MSFQWPAMWWGSGDSKITMHHRSCKTGQKGTSFGVHRFALLPATSNEMDWLPMRSIRWIEMLRMMNQLACMDEDRMTKRVLRWDIELGCV